jgi:hypothetical protein
MNKKIVTHDPYTGEINPYYEEITGERNPLLEEVRRKEEEEEEFGEFGKSSSHDARFEGTAFSPEDGVDLILHFLADELPITSRYITMESVREWIAENYNI